MPEEFMSAVFALALPCFKGLCPFLLFFPLLCFASYMLMKSVFLALLPPFLVALFDKPFGTKPMHKGPSAQQLVKGLTCPTESFNLTREPAVKVRIPKTRWNPSNSGHPEWKHVQHKHSHKVVRVISQRSPNSSRVRQLAGQAAD